VDVRLAADERARFRFPAQVSIQLIRIIQEALTNVRKHARASHAWVHFAADRDCCQITIQDDGKGFDPNRVSKNGQHFGVQIMQERAESVGAKLELDSQPSRGTRVIVRVPFEQSS
jgi:two-component system nitrate/nitrite sensor histidine kinase NarX